ncbi:flagellar protein FliO/FliZ [Clostridium acidisoli DSM 12555]|jgi:flagellar protein FliO/FliZ|uniref:Flagellar protein FliO/FliZ n=1 Tax=Clostridium acidisoli DSM 12555 TaxID=1121291 RepID=A0A1W1X226_9CLOT|nr:flagellar biosynthetic protein FliO [Clostridium acidisoli]SMC17820.1 flagellar protein FliO/FliZ [Clostridium acidisoli DSM 12555]
MLDTFSIIVKLIVALLIILPLIYLSLKYGGNRLQGIQNGSFMKLLERLQISKENSLLVIKIGEKGYVFSSTGDKIEIIMELTKEQIFEIEQSKKIKQYKNMSEFLNDFKVKMNFNDKSNALKSFKNKLKIKKED